MRPNSVRGKPESQLEKQHTKKKWNLEGQPSVWLLGLKRNRSPNCKIMKVGIHEDALSTWHAYVSLEENMSVLTKDRTFTEYATRTLWWCMVDTDILIDAGRNVSEALNCLQQIEQRLPAAISNVTRMELIIGCRNSNELDSLEQFIERSQIIRVNEQISDAAIDFMISSWNFHWYSLLCPNTI